MLCWKNDRTEIAENACRVLEDPRFSEVFSESGLAEVPFSAIVGDQAIVGTIDRLLVTEAEVVIVDYKTARNPPGSLDAIPGSTVRQMAAYAAAMEVIYPNRLVRVGVLYTQTPEMFELPSELLEAHKSRFSAKQ